MSRHLCARLLDLDHGRGHREEQASHPPCSAYCRGESGVYIGVPVMLGRRGMARIVENELSILGHSAEVVKEQLKVLSL